MDGKFVFDLDLLLYLSRCEHFDNVDDDETDDEGEEEERLTKR